ncbi:MAG: nucleotide sugar dehydrogenase [Treponemataceae bacterium]|nr:MAG: nucleotide sugar dehydrogenase [Treponemataceae bacterium]
MAHITIIGTGYVGLVSGSCLADFGNTVICADIDKAKIARLKNAEIPIFEKGLEDVVKRNIKDGRLSFSDDLQNAINASEVIFIAVGTPPAEDGSADLQYVENVARNIGKTATGYKVIVDKSTVPIGTGKKVFSWVSDEIAKRMKLGEIQKDEVTFDVVSNPEFLREGAAVQDFMHPDRIVIGAESEKARLIMKDVYRSLYLGETPYIETNIESAEMIKYASNAFLAVKIAFMNEAANLCEKVGANIQDVARAMGRDGRIGNKFLHPGPGYGGSCFPKDTKAIAKIGTENDSRLSIIEAAIKANDEQKLKMVQKIEDAFKINEKTNLAGKKIAVLGLAFKPETDDMRESSAIVIINELVKKGADIQATDPAAITTEAQWRFGDKSIAQHITFFQNEYDAITGADALVIITEWNQYRNLDLEKVKSMLKKPYFFDFRNIYKKSEMTKKGFFYYGLGQ